jgi:hypothetical protein
MRSFLRRLGGPLAGAAAAIVTIAAANAFAGSGINGVFNLGELNTVDQQTQLSGNAGTNPQLRVENSSASGGALGVLGKMTSASATADSAGVKGITASTNPSAAAVAGRNVGGGPAFFADVKPGAPPLAVNSSTKVANLNADLVDGIDSTNLDPDRFVINASPWSLLSLTGGTFVTNGTGPRATVTASSAGTKTIVLPIPTLELLYAGIPRSTFQFVTIAYKVSSASTQITKTDLVSSDHGGATPVGSNTTVQNSTSLAFYTVNATGAPLILGTAYVQLTVSFPTAGSLTLFGAKMFAEKTS